MLSCSAYHQDLHVFGDAILPSEAEEVRQVEGKINDSAAGCCQVGLVEEDAEEKALHDGGRGEGEQEEKEDEGVAVVQYPSSLQAKVINKQGMWIASVFRNVVDTAHFVRKVSLNLISKSVVTFLRQEKMSLIAIISQDASCTCKSTMKGALNFRFHDQSQLQSNF